MASVARFNPDGVHKPAGLYSHGASVKAGSDLLYVAGQVGMAKDGTVPPTLEEQTELVFQNIGEVLRGGGFAIADIVKLNVYVVATQIAAAQKMRDVRLRHMGDVKPASTLVYVSALAGPEYLIEIEAVAAK